MKLSTAILAASVALAIPSFGAAIATDGSYNEFGFTAGVGSPGILCAGCAGTSPAATVIAPPWTFSGAASIFVLDLFTPGDAFQVFDNAALLGTTSATVTGSDVCGGNIACAIANNAYSRGTFAVGAGSHSITLVVSSAAASQGAAVFSVTGTTSAVPEPATAGLMGGGLAALAFLSRKLRRS